MVCAATAGVLGAAGFLAGAAFFGAGAAFLATGAAALAGAAFFAATAFLAGADDNRPLQALGLVIGHDLDSIHGRSRHDIQTVIGQLAKP